MTLVQPPVTFSPAFPDSPTLPEFETYAERLHNMKYLAAREAEHSRDLYLQGAMAVGQIARLLEELCADNEVDTQEEFTTSMPEVLFLSHEEENNFASWAVDLTDDLDVDSGHRPEYDSNSIDSEDADTTYFRGACIVGDIADLLEDVVRGFGEDNNCSQEPVFSPAEVTSAEASYHHTIDDLNSDLELRLNGLSIRLAKLEIDIDKLSHERCDALTRLETTIAADGLQMEYTGCVPGVDSVGLCVASEAHDGFLITRVSTSMTETTTSEFSLATPPDYESEAQPLEHEPFKDYFWLCNDMQRFRGPAVSPLDDLYSNI